MQFIDLKKQYQSIKEDVLNKIEKVLDHGIYINGPEIQELEHLLANFVHAKHCVAVASGTDALLVALMALGIQPRDEVITTPFTFIATAETICLLGATPVFVDVDPKTYNIDPSLIERAITPRTRAILPVNLYGQCADYDAIKEIANKYRLPIIEDAAQSFGATYKNRPSGNLGTIGCTSFFPSKPLGCYGDGGACFTDNDDIADKLRKIRNHGQSTRYNHVLLGLNSRLDSLQAAILLAKLNVFKEEMFLRQQVAIKYNQRLSDYIKSPFIEAHNQSIYAQYTIEVENRCRVQELLQEKGIPTAVHYSIPLHKQPIFKDVFVGDTSLDISERLAERVLSLPFHPYLQDQELDEITAAIIESLEICAEVV